ncbi:non-ribosomal peptide synthetase [Hymenobacter sp. GOD-10R]|uniref:non-ribosomal peptide synthetase n=1 Tax=Hymenobacter sp. GOD-10R TaxID=3093922 RepID=UPI002D77D0F2|nr:non-ribosomal peptide synthetase [Hymenobacter sp. GOD-10R]WRQ27829.1 amino acid adenylation domain-containing protein [Hymenobacter sp. GOD-10R]
MLPQSKPHALLSKFYSFSSSQSIVHLFEQQVAQTPHATALRFQLETLSYQQLNEQANQLAAYLRQTGLAPRTLVPVCLDRSPQLIVSLLAVLKAGAAYVPLDPSYPLERLRYMLYDTAAPLVLTTEALKPKLLSAATPDLTMVALDGPEASGIAGQPTDNLAPLSSAHDLAYVMYTSGSTGTPKGVLVEHRNVISLVKEAGYVALTPDDILLSTGSPSFDATTFEYWGMLLNGGQLVLATENLLLNNDLLKEEIRVRGVSKMWFTSSWFNQLVDSDLHLFSGLDTILVGGEKLSEPHIQKLKQAYPALTVVNGYGPTENTTFSLTYPITGAEVPSPIPIGQPLSNRTAYVLDEQLQPVAAGTTGELYVGGAGVARGYLNQPELTAERFITDPFSEEEGAHLYKTGDLARTLPSGDIEYLGRLDDQVKVRGYRIELGEVENALNALEHISNSCVVVRQDANAVKRLVSYYVPNWQVVKVKERELYHRQVASWKELYETEYAKTEDEETVDQEFNIIGWNDSFTGMPIPAEQMREWLQDIVGVIFSEKPENVLEIGCGTGLIYYQLAGKVKKYIGTDFSRSCVNQITQHIRKGQRDYGPTELQVGAAHELALRSGEQVDTILLNSIIQYFPGEDYLSEVIAKSISLLDGNGRIILGDVRDNRLLPLFKGRLHAQKAPATEGIREFKWLVEQEVLKEEELCFSPEYFYRLQTLYPQITHVEVQWKNGAYINELTLYRYTVILHVGEKPEVLTPQWQHWTGSQTQSAVSEQLQQGAPVVALQDVPNPRLWRERRLSQLLHDQPEATLGDVLPSLETQDAESLAFAQVIGEAQAAGYHVRLLLDEDPLKMNVVLERTFSGQFVASVYSDKDYRTSTNTTNISLFNDISALLQKDIRTLLQRRLPEYMVPAEFIPLGYLPLTSNGKVDRRFLTQREDRGVINKFNYQAPRNELEQKLATIWQELLVLDKIGIYDNFFELGGHSLLATRVVSAVRKQLAVELVIKDLFVHPTIADLSEYLQAHNKDLVLPAIVAQPRPERIPLSFSQERLWFIDQLEGSVQYHVPIVLRLRGKLNLSALSAALFGILQRHEVLRTVLREQDGQAYQQVLAHDDWHLTQLDGCVYQADPEAVQLQVQQCISKPFDLANDPMLRAALIGLPDPEEHLLVITMHHIASDGWSLSVFFRELVTLYEAHVANQPVQLPPMPVQYADFALWQRQNLSATRLEKPLNYWQEKLANVAQLQLPTDLPRPAVQSTKGASAAFRLDQDLVDKLQVLSQQQGVTLFMTLLSTFKSLLYRYSGQQDICVGSAIAGRQQHEIEELIGFFVNTLALRSQVRGEASFTELLQQVKTTTLEAYEHQQAPFEKVVDLVVKERDLSRSPLFQVMFVLQNTPDVPDLSLGAVKVSREGYEHATAQFDFTFTLTEDELGLQGFVEYSTDLYQSSTVTRMVGHFLELLHSVVKQPQLSIAALPMLTAAEEHELLNVFNTTPVLPASSQSIVALFEAQVASTPHAIAVAFEQQQITYQELNARANQLAYYLGKHGVQAETLVPLCLERSIALLVGILGVLKAGGAYVPLDASYPAERLQYMIEDTGAQLALSSKSTTTTLRGAAPTLTVVEIDGQAQQAIEQESTANPPVVVTAQHLAYVIYTSGSTGRPKGVLVEHGNVVSLVKDVDYVALTSKDILLSTGSPSFDATTFEYWSMLLNGGQLVLCSEDRLLNSTLLREEIQERGVTKMWFTASWFNQLVDVNPLVFAGLDTVLVGGEKLSELHVRQLHEHYPSLRILNGYGPTENTTFSLTHPITSADLSAPVPLPIGRPLPNRTAYVLDERQQLVPVGVAGEVYVGGAGVARAYLNQPALTTEKFVAHPFATKEGTRLYRTGDRGRWRADGRLEYLGRLDEQVKLRGFRIELGEIEAVLQQSALIKQAVVMVRADQGSPKRLVGYVVTEGAFERERIMAYLRSKLPDYMVPTLWVELATLPLTTNGKVNKQALPAPNASALSTEEYEAPRTQAEKTLGRIWQDVLKKETIGIHDNFFELGGDSIITIQIVSRLRQAGYSVQPRDLFVYQTVAKLAEVVAARLEASLHEERQADEPANLDKDVNPLVALQKEGTNAPFFAIPGFLLYRHLVAHIGQEQPFYGLELPFYERIDELPPNERVGELAQHFIREMKQVQPHGPYYLGAFCGYYPIIFEVAQTLLAAGEEVPVLALFEAYPSNALLSKKSATYLKQKAGIYYEELRKKTLFETVQYIAQEAAIKLNFLQRKIAGTKREGYNLKAYPGKVVLFRSSVPTPGLINDPLGGWGQHVTGEIEVLTVTGDHISIFKEPGAVELADKLAKVLEQART